MIRRGYREAMEKLWSSAPECNSILTCRPHFFQRLLQVGNQVIRILQPDVEAYHPVFRFIYVEIFGFEGSAGRERQRFVPAPGNRHEEVPEGVAEQFHLVAAGRFQLNGEQPGRSLHLAGGQFILRKIRVEGEVYFFDAGMLF